MLAYLVVKAGSKIFSGTVEKGRQQHSHCLDGSPYPSTPRPPRCLRPCWTAPTAGLHEGMLFEQSLLLFCRFRICVRVPAIEKFLNYSAAPFIAHGEENIE